MNNLREEYIGLCDVMHEIEYCEKAGYSNYYSSTDIGDIKEQFYSFHRYEVSNYIIALYFSNVIPKICTTYY